jgi:3-methylcrotonyl-CoA carboxylase alpha subunit
VYERTVTLRKDDVSGEPITVQVKNPSPGTFNVIVRTSTSGTLFPTVSAQLVSPIMLRTSLNGELRQTTIVSQPPYPGIPASSSPNTMERLHVFNGGVNTTLVLPPPGWLLSIGGEVLTPGRGALRAPMPSLVVEVRVKVGDKVEKGQAVVVLESMKTETVLRADVAGVVQAVGCKKGEMVQEGSKLVNIAEDAEL